MSSLKQSFMKRSLKSPFILNYGILGNVMMWVTIQWNYPNPLTPFIYTGTRSSVLTKPRKVLNHSCSSLLVRPPTEIWNCLCVAVVFNSSLICYLQILHLKQPSGFISWQEHHLNNPPICPPGGCCGSWSVSSSVHLAFSSFEQATDGQREVQLPNLIFKSLYL